MRPGRVHVVQSGTAGQAQVLNMTDAEAHEQATNGPENTSTDTL
ncbi:hypothetical protein [Streptomyces sp. NPDC059979]